MDEHLISLLEELSLRSYSEDDKFSNGTSTGYSSSASNISSPSEQQLINNAPEVDTELQTAVSSLFRDLKPHSTEASTQLSNQSAGYDKSKLLVALLGNVDLVTCAVRKINRVVSLGKRMEQIYRAYYVDPNVPLDMSEIQRLIQEFSSIYNSESYVREVNVSRMYHAYCKKLVDIYDAYSREPQHQTLNFPQQDEDQEMIS